MNMQNIQSAPHAQITNGMGAAGLQPQSAPPQLPAQVMQSIPAGAQPLLSGHSNIGGINTVMKGGQQPIKQKTRPFVSQQNAGMIMAPAQPKTSKTIFQNGQVKQTMASGQPQFQFAPNGSYPMGNVAQSVVPVSSGSPKMTAMNPNQVMNPSQQFQVLPKQEGQQEVQHQNYQTAMQGPHLPPQVVFPLTKVKLNVKCDCTSIGDRVAIVGNIPELGEWDTSKAKHLDTSAESFPYWTITLNLPRVLIIEYKYIILQYAQIQPSQHIQNYFDIIQQSQIFNSGMSANGVFQMTMSSQQSGRTNSPTLSSNRNNTANQTVGQGVKMQSISQKYSTKCVSVIWEQFGNTQNRRLNTFEKKEVILYEELNNTKVIEEYVEDKNVQLCQPQVLGQQLPQNQAHTNPSWKGGNQNSSRDSALNHSNFFNQSNMMVDNNHYLYQQQQQKSFGQVVAGVQIPPIFGINQQPPAGGLRSSSGSCPRSGIDPRNQGKQSTANNFTSKGPAADNLASAPVQASIPKLIDKNVESLQDNKFRAQKIPFLQLKSDDQFDQKISFCASESSKVINHEVLQTTVMTKQKSTQPPVDNNKSPLSVTAYKYMNHSKMTDEMTHIRIPFSHPGLIIEEQSEQSTYRQQESPDLPYSKKKLGSHALGAGSLPSSSNKAREMSKMKVMEDKPQRRSSNSIPISGQHLVLKEEDLLVDKKAIDRKEPVILASFLLPYNIERAKTGEMMIHKCFHNPTLLFGTLENMMQKKTYNFKWVGLVTTLEDVSQEEKEILNQKFKKLNSYPVFMTAEEIRPFLLFYENIFRPFFHNFKDIYDKKDRYMKYWKDYLLVNQKIAQKIIEVKNELGNVNCIWIHNNHLLMVPLYVKKSYEKANIGLFFHSPFPSSAHFRIFKYRFELIKSLLHCDLVAFHLFMYARNFFKTCHRLCGFEIEYRKGGYLGVNFHGKNVMIRVSHIGVEESFIEEITSSKKFRQMQKNFRDQMKLIAKYLVQNRLTLNDEMSDPKDAKPIIMASIDSYHPISGLKNKLTSYKLFLEKYPFYQNRIVLIQFVGSIVQAFDKDEDHRTNVSSVQNMRHEVLALKDEIHRNFGKQCLIFQESNPTLEKRLALWSQADIILCSSLKDGMCLPVLEYVKCRLIQNKFRESCMICSEFAGCNEAMRGVLTYNPFSMTGFSDIMDKALSLNSEEKEHNMKMAYKYIKRNSVSKWTEEFLQDLKLAYQPILVTYYLGLNMEAQSGELAAIPNLKFSQNSIPTKEVREQLHGLLIDNRNTVVLIGNQTKTTLEELFGRNAGFSNGNNFWLAAESGYLYKLGNKESWQKLTQLEDRSWIANVRKIMQAYTDNIDGSFIEERQSCILWNYMIADKEHGLLFIQDLYNSIAVEIKGTNIEIIHGNGYLEVKPIGIKKQKLMDLLLEKISQNSKIDFLFYLGNDSSDEPVYDLLKSDKTNQKYLTGTCAKYITVLEKKPTFADYFIEEISTVQPLLEKLYVSTKKRKKLRSFEDLTVIQNQIYNPLAGQKLTRQNKNASIANLQQYFQSKIGLNDENIKFNNAGDGRLGSFIPKQSLVAFKLSTPQAHMITEEKESMEEAAQSRPLCKNQKKFPSVGNPSMLGSSQNINGAKTQTKARTPLDSISDRNKGEHCDIDTPQSFKKNKVLNKDKIDGRNESSNVDDEKISDGIALTKQSD